MSVCVFFPSVTLLVTFQVQMEESFDSVTSVRRLA